jgi:hypothetical protein
MEWRGHCGNKKQNVDAVLELDNARGFNNFEIPIRHTDTKGNYGEG